MKRKQWTAIDTTKARYVGWLEVYNRDGEEVAFFEIMETETHIAFGGACNAGFLESGHILKEEGEDEEDCMDALYCDLQTFYCDGPDYVSRIVFNERM